MGRNIDSGAVEEEGKGGPAPEPHMERLEDPPDPSAEKALVTDVSDPQNRNMVQRKKTAVIVIAIVLVVSIILIVWIVVTLPRSCCGPATSSCSIEQPSEISEYYESTSGPFTFKVPTFSADIARGYENQQELEEGLSSVAKFVLNNGIYRNANVDCYQHAGLGLSHPAASRGDGIPVPESAGAAASPQDDGSSSKGGTVGSSSDFETNNQVAGVDEADLVKSDGNLTYAAYGDYLIVWNKTGDLVHSLRMPAAEVSSADYGYPRLPHIEGLLLEGNRLAVIISRYGERHELGYRPIFFNYRSLQIRIYETKSLELIREESVNGRYISGRSFDGRGYLVSSTGIDIYNHLIEPIQRFNPIFSGLTDKAYIDMATVTARSLIEPFVRRTIQELSINSKLPSLFRTGLWQTTISGSGRYESMVYGDGIANSYTQVLSFNIGQAGSDSSLAEMHAVGCFMPTSWGHVYATREMIVFTGQGWNWFSEQGGPGETTYLLGVAVDNGKLSPAAVGMVDGSILNQFSVDIQGKYMRIATTISSNFWFPFWRDVAFVDAEAGNAEVSRTQNHVIIVELPDIVVGGNETATLEEVGRIRLGKPNERFTTVRFFPEVAYAVTFLRRDPFYVLNLTDPKNPQQLAELDISGFSSHLHPINDDNTLLLAIGQEANDDGVSLGFQITLFNATDPTNPRDIQRHVVEDDMNQHSHSHAEWDHLAFRYLDLGNATGRLIVPLAIYGSHWDNHSDNFDGFSVFAISTEAIEPLFNISHLSWEKDDRFSQCRYYYCGRLPERSLVIDGNVMTMKRQTVVSSNLDSGERKWTLDLAHALNQSCCRW